MKELNHNHIDLLKIDVENIEYVILVKYIQHIFASDLYFVFGCLYIANQDVSTQT